MATEATLRYLIETNPRELRMLKDALEAVNDEVGDGTEKASGKGSRGLGKFGGAAKFVAGGALAGLGFAAKIGFGELAEGSKVAAQTEAVLKSTGGAAGVTAKDIDRLAGSLSKKSGVDDETIQSGQNMLLTFTKVRNETGKGNDVFDQATKAMLDMSVALGQDAKTSAMQLGKALNDPVKGAAALRKVGVDLGEGTQNLIKDLVEGKSAFEALDEVVKGRLTPSQLKAGLALKKSDMTVAELAKTIGVKLTPAQHKAAGAMTEGGKYAEAQRIILKELNTEFGGSAKAAGDTLPGQLNKARNAFEGMAGDLVASLLPALTRLTGIVAQATKFLSEHEGVTKVAIATVGALALGVFAVSGALKAYAAAQKIVTAATWLWNTALAANPLALVAIALVGLGVALYIAWKKSETFREIVTGAFDTVKRGAQLLATFVTQTIPKAFTDVSAWADKKLDEVVGFFTGLPNRIRASAIAALSGLFGEDGAFRGAIRPGLNWVGEKVDAVVGFFTGLPGRIRAGAVGALTGLFGEEGAFRGAIRWVGEKVDDVVGFFRSLPGRVVGAVAALGTAAGLGPDGPFRRVFRLAEEFVGEKVDGIVGFFRELPGRAGAAISEGAAKLKDAVVDLFSRLPGWARKILGINSPSSVFAEIGANVVQGLIQGLERMGPALRGKAMEMATDLLKAGPDITGAISGAGQAVHKRLFGGGGGEARGAGSFGGSVSGDLDFSSTLLARLNAMSAATGRAIYVQSGGRTLDEQWQLWNLWKAGLGNRAAYPNPNAPHVRGIAADITPGREVFGALASRFGLGFPVGDEPWHTEMFHGGGVVPGPSSRDVPAILRGQEVVFTRDQMRALGPAASPGLTVNFHVERMESALDAELVASTLSRHLAIAR